MIPNDPEDLPLPLDKVYPIQRDRARSIIFFPVVRRPADAIWKYLKADADSRPHAARCDT